MLEHSGAEVIRPQPRWHEKDSVASTFNAAVEQLLPTAPLNVIWAAGVGHTGATTDLMSAETAALQSVCDIITGLPVERRTAMSLLFASSAGALYGGHGDTAISEGDPPRPITRYGYEKLAQEALLQDFAEANGCRVVICRYSNLYGLANGRVTARGLVSTAVRAARLRQPMVVYVGPDTRRDILFSTDAAAESLRLLDSAHPGVTIALVRDGGTRTVSEILALVGRVAGRRVPATYAELPETRLQPKVLRYTRPPHPMRRTPMEVAIHVMLRSPLAS